MATIAKPPSKSVFVGNIPYGLTEEQIIDIFSRAGKVVSFRLVYDRETGRPKGFGFAEYPDADSAASAVRNLNDFEIMNRKLRVDFSNDADQEEAGLDMSYIPPPPSNGIAAPPVPIPTAQGVLPPLPAGSDLPAGLTCPDAISRTLNTLPPSQLLDVLSQMKTLVTTDPVKATALLNEAPQLSYAIFQALLLMDLVSTESLSAVIEQASAPVPQPAAQVPPSYTQPAGYPPVGYPPARNTPPVHTLPYQPAAAGYGSVPPPPPPPAAPAPAGADTEGLIQQVLAMPQSLIDQLPPAERAQIMALKSQFMGGR